MNSTEAVGAAERAQQLCRDYFGSNRTLGELAEELIVSERTAAADAARAECEKSWEQERERGWVFDLFHCYANHTDECSFFDNPDKCNCGFINEQNKIFSAQRKSSAALSRPEPQEGK